MKSKEQNQLNFANWVPAKMVSGPGILGLVCIGLSVVHWLFWIPAVLFLLISAYFGSVWYLFSSGGGDIQNRVQELVIHHIHSTKPIKMAKAGSRRLFMVLLLYTLHGCRQRDTRKDLLGISELQ